MHSSPRVVALQLPHRKGCRNQEAKMEQQEPEVKQGISEKGRGALSQECTKTSDFSPDSCSCSSCLGTSDYLKNFTALVTILGVTEGFPSRCLCFSYKNGFARMTNPPAVPGVPETGRQGCSKGQSCPSLAHPLAH